MPKDIRDIEAEAVMKSRRERSVDVEKETLVQKIAGLIRTMMLQPDEIKLLYDSITVRMVSKTCFKCARLKPEMGGIHTYPDGDMSKPRRFVCGDCK